MSASLLPPWEHSVVPLFDAPRDEACTCINVRNLTPIRFDIDPNSCEALRDLPKIPSVEDLIYEPARRVVSDLEGKNIPAADLTNEQKCALFTLAGFMKYENGRMVSIRPVGIFDRGDGGYLLGIAPS